MSAATFTTNLASVLPAPRNAPTVEDDETPYIPSGPKQVAPSYPHRKGWRPSKPEDFGDGGAYPECHIAQYPLDMGRKKNRGKTLSLQVDGEGNVRYDAIAQQGHRSGALVQSQYKDTLPLARRTDVKDTAMERPSEDDVQATADRTRAALEKIVGTKIKAAQPKNVEQTGGQVSYIRYTPSQGNGSDQRIIKMSEVVEDPLEPPRFKHKKVPRGPPSPPPPVLRSPPRKATAVEQKEWMIPPCISNWKNNKGYTIPLDKRLAADGRGLQDVHINDNFAKFSEALFIGERHAREEVRERNLMQQRLAEKEKAAKEETLRQLAQRAREERAGIAPSASAAAASSSRTGAMPAALAGYGSESEEESEAAEEAEEDAEAARERERMRREKRQEREREMRLSHMGQEQRAKQLAREQNRDISEKVALGLAKPTLSKESMIDSRLFNQESLGTSFGEEDSYNLYDRPLFAGSSAAAAIYKHRNAEGDDELVGGGTEEGISNAMRNDRFGLGVATKGFEGADLQEAREGPVQFEKDDPFGVDKFLDEAKKGAPKRGLDTSTAESRKRQKGAE